MSATPTTTATAVTSRPWSESLVESVEALAEAADRMKRALQHAVWLCDGAADPQAVADAAHVVLTARRA